MFITIFQKETHLHNSNSVFCASAPKDFMMAQETSTFIVNFYGIVMA